MADNLLSVTIIALCLMMPPSQIRRSARRKINEQGIYQKIYSYLYYLCQMSLTENETCASDCPGCKQQHHRDMKTVKYHQIPDGMVLIDIPLCVELLNNRMIPIANRNKLSYWLKDAN